MRCIATSILLFIGTPALGAETFGEQRFYLGDLHAHTGASDDGGSSDITGSCDGGDDQCWAVADIHQTAKDNGMDFWALTDHINADRMAPESLYNDLITDLLAHSVDDEYVTIPGGEVWFDIDGVSTGHKTLLVMGSDAELEGLTMPDMQMDGRSKDLESCASIWDYAERLEETIGNVMLVPHHPGLITGMATDWNCHVGHDRASWYAPAVEIYSNHGNSEHHETEFDPAWTGFSETSTVGAAIDPAQHNLKLSFIGGTDRHDTRPGETCARDTQHRAHPYGGGLTIVALDEDETFDRPAIFEAIHDGRSYATSGPLVPVHVTYKQGDVVIGSMGDSLEVDVTQPLTVVVQVPAEWDAYVTAVDLVTPENFDGTGIMIRDTGGRWFGELEAAEFSAYVYPRLIIDGGTWYDGDCENDGGSDDNEQVWVSPSYLTLVSTTGVEESGDPVDEDCDEELADCDTRVPDWMAESGTAMAQVADDDAAETSLDNEPVELGCSSAPGAALWLALAVAPTLRRRRDDA